MVLFFSQSFSTSGSPLFVYVANFHDPAIGLVATAALSSSLPHPAKAKEVRKNKNSFFVKKWWC